jgi:hypothetical protein
MPKEKDFQTKFNKWLMHNWSVGGVSGAFELKLEKGKSLPFSAVKDHQERALSLAKHHGLVYKIPDGNFEQKPFDVFILSQAAAFVVLQFYRHGQKEFIMINIDNWLKEKATSKRKSLTEERAKEIGTTFYLS